MKNIVIKDGNIYSVMQGNSFDIQEQLPTKIFILGISKNGYFLEEEQNSKFNLVDKFYGEIENQTNRIISTFKIFERNLGVLFSGPKGLGKSLTIRNVCEKCIKDGIPVILIKENLGNITDFIQKIVQPCVIVFDEFEKIYQNDMRNNKDDINTQNDMLDLFDSSLSGKKLFLLSCNDCNKISEFLLARPGRIHYHFKFERIKIDEIREYCNDNLKKEYSNIIEDICYLSTQISNFSYDMLKAVVFEINNYGSSIKEAREILNIDSNDTSYYEIFCRTQDDEIFKYNAFLNLNKSSLYYFRLDNETRKGIDFAFDFSNVKWNGDKNGTLIVDKNYATYHDPNNERKRVCVKECILTPKQGGGFSMLYDYD